MSDELADLWEATGDLIDALHDELRYEIKQSPHVFERIVAVCQLLGSPYSTGYIERGWL